MITGVLLNAEFILSCIMGCMILGLIMAFLGIFLADYDMINVGFRIVNLFGGITSILLVSAFIVWLYRLGG